MFDKIVDAKICRKIISAKICRYLLVNPKKVILKKRRDLLFGSVDKARYLIGSRIDRR